MANDRDDFAPEVRNAAWWSGDTRRAANGRANEAVLEKLGMKERADLSGVEAVQMGHVMQPIIGRLAQDKLRMELKEADYALTHKTEPWLRSHFDFISADGTTLVEAKNYNAAVRNKFDPDSNRIPAADLAQCIHEATVHGVNRVYLAVLFGGQEFHTFEVNVSQEQKDELIKTMAVFWGHVANGTPLAAETADQARDIFKSDNGSSVVASVQMEQAYMMLKELQGQIKDMETKEDYLKTLLMNYMGDNSELTTVDGRVLATWRSAKASQRFDPKLFQKAMPDMYQQFVVEQSGSRRFLTK